MIGEDWATNLVRSINADVFRKDPTQIRSFLEAFITLNSFFSQPTIGGHAMMCRLDAAGYTRIYKEDVPI